MRLNATRLGSIASSRSFGDQLDDLAGQVPNLDLNFAKNKSLIDDYTGQNLVTHTRASSGTFVGSDGLIKTAVTNLLLRSEEFDNASWTKTGLLAFGSGSTLNATVAPDGQTTADLLTENTSTSEHRVETAAISWAANTTYTLSMFAKANGRTRIDFFGVGGGNFTGGRNVSFNLSTGAVIVTDGAVGSIEAKANGWYRIRMTFTASAAPSASQLYIRFLDNSNNFSYTGDGTSGIYLWGAQLEQASTVGDYVPTTSVINSAPRFDHNPTTGESLGLLVEEQRTNLLTYSELFNASPWAPGSLSVASTTETTSPAGINTATRFTENTAAAQFHFINHPLTKAASAIQYTLSGYGKAGGRELILSAANGATGSVARFNLATGVITAVATGYGGGFTAQGSTITPVGNGWYRFSMTFTTDTTTGLTIQFALYNTALATNVYTGDGISGVYAWGVQLEAGAFPTSYIPTTTAAATRSADVASITGTNFSSWYNQTEGSVFANYRCFANTAYPDVFNISDGTNLNRQQQFIDGSNGFTTFRELVSNAQQGIASQVSTMNSEIKSVGAYSSIGLVFTLNGLNPSANANVTHPTGLNRLSIGSSAAGITNYFNGTIKRLTYWPTRLANSTLQTITQ